MTDVLPSHTDIDNVAHESEQRSENEIAVSSPDLNGIFDKEGSEAVIKALGQFAMLE